MKVYLVRFTLLLALLATAAGCATPVEQSDVLITNARLIDGGTRSVEPAYNFKDEDVEYIGKPLKQ